MTNVFEGSILNYKKNGIEFLKAWRIVPIKENGVILYYFAVHQEMSRIDDYNIEMNKIIQVQKNILTNLEKLSQSMSL